MTMSFIRLHAKPYRIKNLILHSSRCSGAVQPKALFVKVSCAQSSQLFLIPRISLTFRLSFINRSLLSQYSVPTLVLIQLHTRTTLNIYLINNPNNIKMRFFQMVASSAAFIAAALALEINSYPSTGVVAGQTYQVTYSPADNTPTTFILRKGVSTNLDTLATITCTFDSQ